jgi:hypothetical protein
MANLFAKDILQDVLTQAYHEITEEGCRNMPVESFRDLCALFAAGSPELGIVPNEPRLLGQFVLFSPTFLRSSLLETFVAHYRLVRGDNNLSQEEFVDTMRRLDSLKRDPRVTPVVRERIYRMVEDMIIGTPPPKDDILVGGNAGPFITILSLPNLEFSVVVNEIAKEDFVTAVLMGGPYISLDNFADLSALVSRYYRGFHNPPRNRYELAEAFRGIPECLRTMLVNTFRISRIVQASIWDDREPDVKANMEMAVILLGLLETVDANIEKHRMAGLAVPINWLDASARLADMAVYVSSVVPKCPGFHRLSARTRKIARGACTLSGYNRMQMIAIYCCRDDEFDDPPSHEARLAQAISFIDRRIIRGAATFPAITREVLRMCLAPFYPNPPPRDGPALVRAIDSLPAATRERVILTFVASEICGAIACPRRLATEMRESLLTVHRVATGMVRRLEERIRVESGDVLDATMEEWTVASASLYQIANSVASVTEEACDIIDPPL